MASALPPDEDASGGIGHNSRRTDIERTAAEIRAKFLVQNANADLPYRMRVEAALMSDLELSDAAKVVGYFRLKASDRETGKNSWQSPRTIGALTNKSVRQVERCDTALEDAGYVSRQRRRNMTSLFTMISREAITKLIGERVAVLRNDRTVVSGNRETLEIDTSQTVTNDMGVVSDARQSLSNDKTGIEKRHPCRITPVNTPEVRKEESAAADSSASAREAAAEAAVVDVDFVELEQARAKRPTTPAESQKADRKEFGKRERNKRQPDMMKAAEVTGTEIAVTPVIIRQVQDALDCWFTAMGDLWKGAYVTKAHRRAMRQLIEDDSFDYVISLGQGLKTLQFGKGKIKGHVLLLDDLLFDPPGKPGCSADKRRKVLGLYQQPAKTEAATILGSEDAGPTRFPVGKRAFPVHQIDIQGEDCNAILDEVSGATYSMVRKTFIAATEEKVSLFAPTREGYDASKDPFAKAGLGQILKWVRLQVAWTVAYATHGDPEKLAGGPAAKNGSARFGYANGHVISAAFVADLLHRFPAARIDEAGRAFDSLALNVPDYSPETQKRLEAQMLAWAEGEQAKADERERERREANERREAKIQADAAALAAYGLEKQTARYIDGSSGTRFVVANPAPLQARFPTLSVSDIQTAAAEVMQHDAADDFIADLDWVLAHRSQRQPQPVPETTENTDEVFA